MGNNSSNNLVLSFILLLSLTSLFIELDMVMATKRNKTMVNIGVIVDSQYDWNGKMGLSCIDLALSHLKDTHPHINKRYTAEYEWTSELVLISIDLALSDFRDNHPHLKLKFRLHTKCIKRDSTVSAATAAMELVKYKKVQAILLGSATSAQTQFITEFGEKAQVPIISFSESSFSLSSNQNPYFFRATRSNADNQAKAIAAIIKRFQWRRVVPIYVDNEYGRGIIPYLTNVFQDYQKNASQAVDIQVSHWSPISPSANYDQICEMLKKLNKQPTRVFIVHMFPDLGSRLFTIAKELGMMEEGYVWILTDGMANFLRSFNLSVIDSMQGVLGIRPYVPETKSSKDFRDPWKKKFYQKHPDRVDVELNIDGESAYDATTALAMAIKEACSNPEFLETDADFENGQNLMRALSKISFRGLTGEFFFVDGQLQQEVLQIVNVNNEATRVGLWTPGTGLVKRLKDSAAENSSSKSGLYPIVWPGDPSSIPQGWAIPRDGSRMRVGVPNSGFRQFVNVNNVTNKYEGYSIGVFEEAMKSIPYAQHFEYVPFSGNYNELVDQVHNGQFDAAVGDVSIVANRSLYIDYTLPYISSGVCMIVPTKEETEGGWAFLKPLTWELWSASICFFIFIAFVIWVLEHRINDEFQGPLSRQIGASFWFSFSTMVFAHRERLVSNLSRVVIIIWCFVLLILTQSYTASLTTFLAVKELEPSTTDLNDLLKKNVGYQRSSFVHEILRSFGFEEHQLIPYDSAENCHHLLTTGTEHGGISAAFDELPYANLILAQDCRKYTTVDPFSELKIPLWVNTSKIQEFRTDGFGFVFPKGSPLVQDISREILKVTQRHEIKRLENRWFNGSCSSNMTYSSRLGLQSFWGLFLISGVSSLLALLIYTAMFVYRYKGVVTSADDSRTSLWSTICRLIRIFYQKHGHSQRINAVDNGISLGYPDAVVGSGPPDFSRGQGTHSLVGRDLNSNAQTLFPEIELANAYPNQEIKARN